MIWHKFPVPSRRTKTWCFVLCLLFVVLGLLYARMAFLCHDALTRGEKAAATKDVPLSIVWFGKAASFSLPFFEWDDQAQEHLSDITHNPDIPPTYARMARLALAAAQKTAPDGMSLLRPRRPWLAITSSLLFLVFLSSMVGLMFLGFTSQMELRPAPARFWGTLAIVSFSLWAIAVHAA